MKVPNITSTIILLAIPPLTLFLSGLGNENLVPIMYIDIGLLFLATLAKYFTQKKEEQGIVARSLSIGLPDSFWKKMFFD